MIRIVLIGAGNVAHHLLQAFSASKLVTVAQVYNHSETGLGQLSFSGKKTTVLEKLEDADAYIMAIPDDAVATVSKALPFSGRLVIHTSGSVPLDAIDPKNNRGVLYPLQTFSKQRHLDYATIPVCLEAESEKDYMLLERLGKAISGQTHRISSEERKQLHLAAVFVCNFVNHLYHIGFEITGKNQLPFSLLLPLIRETASKLDSGTPAELQTGPAKRNDKKTMAKHLDALDLPEHKKIYSLLSEAIQHTYGRKKL